MKLLKRLNQMKTRLLVLSAIVFGTGVVAKEPDAAVNHTADKVSVTYARNLVDAVEIIADTR
jgi:hypothetical protein